MTLYFLTSSLQSYNILHAILIVNCLSCVTNYSNKRVFVWGLVSIFLLFIKLNYLKMLSIAARSIKTTSIKSTLRPLTAIRTKVTLPDLPYGYDVSIILVI